MSKPRPRKPAAKSASIRIKLDPPSMRQLVEAAQRRGMSVPEFVRTTAISQARRELDSAQAGVIVLTPAEQLAFWTALNARVRLTIAQRRLARVMRGEV